MNQRIQELALQAGLYDGKSPKEVPGFTACFEKFAELIVQECMKLNSKELSITAIERLLPLYKEHFGVGE